MRVEENILKNRGDPTMPGVDRGRGKSESRLGIRGFPRCFMEIQKVKRIEEKENFILVAPDRNSTAVRRRCKVRRLGLRKREKKKNRRGKKGERRNKRKKWKKN